MKRVFLSLVLATVLCTILTGCMAFNISHLTKEGKSESLPGVPFYTKFVACEQETVWIEAIYKLTLTGTTAGTTDQKPAMDVFSYTKEVSLWDTNQSADFEELIEAVSQKEPNEAIAAFKSLTQHEVPMQGPLLNTAQLVLASNKNKPFVFIDYADPYYYNARVPLAGSVTAEINLNQDLILTKASVNIQEQTLKTISDMFISAAGMVKAGKAAKAAKAAKAEIQLKLTMKPQVYQYTISSMGEKTTNLPCGNPGKPLDDASKGTFQCTLVAADEPAGGSKEKEGEGNAIKFSGSVITPKTPPVEKPANAK